MFYNKSVIGFQDDKIKIATNSNNITELFDKISILLDNIIALNGKITSPAGPCSFDVSTFNNLKSEINSLKSELFV